MKRKGFVVLQPPVYTETCFRRHFWIQSAEWNFSQMQQTPSPCEWVAGGFSENANIMLHNLHFWDFKGVGRAQKGQKGVKRILPVGFNAICCSESDHTDVNVPKLANYRPGMHTAVLQCKRRFFSLHRRVNPTRQRKRFSVFGWNVVV